MSAVTLNLQFDEASRAAFQRQLERFNRDLGNSPQDTLRVGTIALCRALQASTKVAPRRRKVTASRTSRRQRLQGNRIFKAEALDKTTGATVYLPIFAPDLPTAKLHPKARIRKYGLARSSWGWAMQRLFGAPASARSGLTEPPGSVHVSKMIDRATGYAQAVIENRLDYISKALQGGRGHALASAMARAAGAMKGRIDQAINKATRDAGY